MESRIELAIARQTEELNRQTEELKKTIRNHSIYFVIALCAQAAFALGLLILLKFH
jgi:hypothetical protein